MPTSLSDIKVKNSTSTLVIKPDDITINGVSIVGQNSFADRDLSNLSTAGQAVLDNKANNNDVVHKTGNETIADIKTFTSTVTRRHEFTSNTAKTLSDVDTNGKGNIAIIPYYTGNKIYHRTYAENNTSGKHAYLDVTVDDSGNAGLQYSGNASTFNINFVNATQVNVPTPATSDNSTKIATTAFVKAQGYLTSHQSLANYVTLNSAQTITATKTVQNASLAVKSTVTDDEASSISNNIEYGMVINDKNNSRIGNFYGGQLSNGKIRTYMCACRPVNGAVKYQYAEIQQDVNGIGNFNISCSTATAPTPGVTDNSTKIATTAFVNNKFKVVSALPASPTSGVFYFVKE